MFGGKYQTCSVSTCNTKKTGLAFCCVACWDAHLGFANHRESSAIEKTAPSHAGASIPAAKKIVIRSNQSTTFSLPEVDTLVVVSKVKKIIQDRSGYNTSQCAVDALTEIVVKECLKAIDKARASGRKTVMGRDF